MSLLDKFASGMGPPPSTLERAIQTSALIAQDLTIAQADLKKAQGDLAAARSVEKSALARSEQLQRDFDAANKRAELNDEARVRAARRVNELERLLEEKNKLIEQRDPSKAELDLARLAGGRQGRLSRVSSELTALAARFGGSAAHEQICNALQRLAKEAVTEEAPDELERVLAANEGKKS